MHLHTPEAGMLYVQFQTFFVQLGTDQESRNGEEQYKIIMWCKQSSKPS